jgi:hypothetical protein
MIMTVTIDLKGPFDLREYADNVFQKAESTFDCLAVWLIKYHGQLVPESVRIQRDFQHSTSWHPCLPPSLRQVSGIPRWHRGCLLLLHGLFLINARPDCLGILNWILLVFFLVIHLFLSLFF